MSGDRGWRGTLPYAVLLAEVLVFYGPVLFTRDYVIPYDLRDYHLGPAYLAAQSLRAGELPLWDPYTYCGFPLYANPQVQLFYPPAWVFFGLSWLLGPGSLLRLLEWQVALHVWLGGVFTWWLLGRLRVGRWAALLGATIFQLGGYFASQTQHLGAVSGAAWLPLGWLCVVALAERFSRRWTALLAVALAMSVLAGFPAVTIVVFVSCGLLAGTLVLLRQAPLALLAAVVAAGLWSGLLAAMQLLPSMELVRLSTAPLRGRWADPQGGGVPLVGLLSLIVPNHSHIFDLERYTLSWNPTFLYLYCGLPGLLLAGAALTRWRERRVAVFGLVTLLSGLWMLGRSTPAGGNLFSVLPEGAKAPLYPEFAMVSFVLGMAVLAGLGAGRLFAQCGGLLPAGVVALAAVDLIAAGAGRPMNTAAVRSEPGVSHEQFEGSRETLARLRERVNRTLPPARVDTVDDSYHWAMSAAMLGVPTANGNDPLALTRYLAVRRLFAPGPEWERHHHVSVLDSPVLDLLNIRYLLTWAPSEALLLKHPKFPKVETLPGHHVHENPGVLPRFFLVGEVRRAGSLEQTLSVLRAPEFDPRRVAVVEGTAAALPAGGLPAGGTVRVLRYGAREVELETDTPQPALLVTSEVSYPGWRAWVAGRELPLLMTNGAFRGLPVPGGRHRVLMRFAPRILWYGLALSALGWALVGLTFRNNSGRDVDRE